MMHKFAVGQAVEYSPFGQAAALYTVTRHLPVEDRDGERKYRLKRLSEGFERTAPEYDLTATDRPESAYISTGPRMR